MLRRRNVSELKCMGMKIVDSMKFRPLDLKVMLLYTMKNWDKYLHPKGQVFLADSVNTDATFARYIKQHNLRRILRV